MCIFFLSLWLVFHFVNVVFQREEVLNFGEVQFVSLFFYDFCFLGTTKFFAYPKVAKLPPMLASD